MSRELLKEMEVLDTLWGRAVFSGPGAINAVAEQQEVYQNISKACAAEAAQREMVWQNYAKSPQGRAEQIRWDERDRRMRVKGGRKRTYKQFIQGLLNKR